LPITEDDFLKTSKLSKEEQVKILQFCQWRLESIYRWDRDTIFETLKSLAAQLDIKMKDFLSPVFVAIAGTASSFSVMDSMAMLGSDLSRMRIRHAIEVMGGVSKNQAKLLEKDYKALSVDEHLSS